VKIKKKYCNIKTTFEFFLASVIFAGGILANLLLGEPVLAPLKANNQLLLSTVVWYSSFSLLPLKINKHKGGIVSRDKYYIERPAKKKCQFFLFVVQLFFKAWLPCY
jgi:hypothetical protein